MNYITGNTGKILIDSKRRIRTKSQETRIKIGNKNQELDIISGFAGMPVT